jgi:hypothetical protein
LGGEAGAAGGEAGTGTARGNELEQAQLSAMLSTPAESPNTVRIMILPFGAIQLSSVIAQP